MKLAAQQALSFQDPKVVRAIIEIIGLDADEIFVSDLTRLADFEPVLSRKLIIRELKECLGVDVSPVYSKPLPVVCQYIRARCKPI